MLRDLDILHDINKQAILSNDLSGKFTCGAFVSFSFSTVDAGIGKIFEPGAPFPEKRLEALQKISHSGLLTGVSMMPLIPYISDTGEHLELMFNTFKAYGARYALPANITLFGDGASDSKQLIFRAIEKYYPQLIEKYQKLFLHSNEVPAYYREAFYKKMKELSEKYQLKNSIV